jgi:hypothetical protein
MSEHFKCVETKQTCCFGKAPPNASGEIPAETLGSTTSFCPICLDLIPAVIREDASGVVDVALSCMH